MDRENLILLVEDSADDAEIISCILRKSNALNEIVVARDGVEALDYLLGTGGESGQEPKPAPALILLDLNLPRIGGLAVLRRVRSEERTRRIPVVILTGSREERNVLSSHDLGANRFLAKPVDVAQFALVARQLGLGRLVT